MIERIDIVLDYMREAGEAGAIFSNIPSGFIPGKNEELFPFFDPTSAKVVSFGKTEWIDMGMPPKIRVVVTPVMIRPSEVKGGDGA